MQVGTRGNRKCSAALAAMKAVIVLALANFFGIAVCALYLLTPAQVFKVDDNIKLFRKFFFYFCRCHSLVIRDS